MKGISVSSSRVLSVLIFKTAPSPPPNKWNKDIHLPLAGHPWLYIIKGSTFYSMHKKCTVTKFVSLKSLLGASFCKLLFKQQIINQEAVISNRLNFCIVLRNSVISMLGKIQIVCFLGFCYCCCLSLSLS